MDRVLRSARLATFAFFALNGFVMGMWIVHIPVVEHRAGISHAVLGWLLLLLGGGAFAGMQLVGPLTDRFGARKVVPASATLCSAALVLPGLAVNGWTLAAALLILGFGNGCLDVSMNTHAVQVERGYQRPVMSAFHAMFSVGGVLASLVGARTLSWGWSAAVTLVGVSVFGLAATALAAAALLPPEPGRTWQASTAQAKTQRRTSPRIWALAALALMLMLCEGVANDWSVLDLRDVLDAPAATAALAYGGFSTAMTVGRLLTDRVAARFGPVAIVRYGASLAALGLTAVALSPWIPLAVIGWTAFGIGLSGCIPQLFSAAGHADRDAAGANVSRVAGLGYLGMLAGPAVIGALTQFIPLNLAFSCPWPSVQSQAARLRSSGPSPKRRPGTGSPPSNGSEARPPGGRQSGRAIQERFEERAKEGSAAETAIIGAVRRGPARSAELSGKRSVRRRPDAVSRGAVIGEDLRDD